MSPEPTSRLTRERPDLWHRTVALATRVTGCLYVPKEPLADGTISACGGDPAPLPTPEEQRRNKIKHAKANRDFYRRRIEGYEMDIEDINAPDTPDGLARIERLRGEIQYEREKLDRTERELTELGVKTAPLVIPVPDGAMEWLLHEAGHWIVSTPEERALPNYGYGTEAKGHGKLREWQAWGFEEIILAPWGPSRMFCPPTHRGGVAFSQNGPMPEWATAHADREIARLGLDVEEWRTLYREWIRWNPDGWKSVN